MNNNTNNTTNNNAFPKTSDIEYENESNNNNQSGGKKSKKEKKAKGTRKLSGYMKFAQEVRPQLLKENPSMRSDIPAIGRAIGAKWRALSDAEKAKY